MDGGGSNYKQSSKCPNKLWINWGKGFYIPQIDLLMANKDNEPNEQDPDVEAPRIKTKLISFTKFLSFLRRAKNIYWMWRYEAS